MVDPVWPVQPPIPFSEEADVIENATFLPYIRIMDEHNPIVIRVRGEFRIQAGSPGGIRIKFDVEG